MSILVKTVVSALLIAAASEAAKRSSILGALIASLPLTSLLTIGWICAESRDGARIAAFSDGVFWAVLASLPMFLVLSWAIKKGAGFFPSLGLSCATALIGYGAVLFEPVLGRDRTLG